MPPYKTMYFHLFNAITNALREMERQNYRNVMQILTDAQQRGEERYVEPGEKPE